MPADHKFLVLGGRLRLVQVDTGRFTEHRRRLYRPDWTPVDVTEAMAPGTFTAPPKTLARMTEVAEALGAAFDFVQVDLYEVDGEVWFGELTPYPGGGLDRCDPALDVLLGTGGSCPRDQPCVRATRSSADKVLITRSAGTPHSTARAQPASCQSS